MERVWHVWVKSRLHLEMPSLQRGNLPPKTLKHLPFGDEVCAVQAVHMELLPRFAGVKVSRIIVVNERVTVCLEYRLNGEKTAYIQDQLNGKSAWLRTKVCWEFESLILYHMRTRAESVFFIFTALLSYFILTDSPLILSQDARRRI